jgi:hypothetical protein
MSGISDEAISNRMVIAEIKRRYYSNEITREEAKQLAKPILDRINYQAKEIAMRHGRKPYKIDFTNAMRNSYEPSQKRFVATDEDVEITRI